MAYHTKLKGHEIQEIAGRYALKVRGFEPIEQGFSNSNYLLNTNRGKYILTVFEVSPARVLSMVEVLQQLDEYNFPAPRIQPMPGGELLTKYDAKQVLIKPYIPGQIRIDLDAAKIKQVGAALAKLHEIPAPDDLHDRHTYVVTTLPVAMAQTVDRDYQNWVEQRVRFLTRHMPSGMPVGLVHGDIFADNLVFEQDNLAAILDFEDVSRVYQVFDLGMAVVGICTEGGKVNLNKVRALVRGYQTARQLEEDEKNSLQLFVEWSAVLTSTWRFWKYNLDESGSENANRHLELVRIAEDARSIPPTVFMKAVSLT